MTIAIYTYIVSPHLIPLAREIASIIGEDNFFYICTTKPSAERLNLGWSQEVREKWVVYEKDCTERSRSVVEGVDCLICSFMSVDLFEWRLKRKKATFYINERWYKPIVLGRIRFWHGVGLRISLSGKFRLLSPAYRTRARRFVQLFKFPQFHCLAIGRWAVEDISWTARIFGVKIPKGGLITWGYYVEPSDCPTQRTSYGALRLLWVGRMLDWKRVDTIISAVKRLNKKGYANEIELSIYGEGAAASYWKMLATSSGNIHFYDPVEISAIRSVMRENDVYILSSSAYEGWGAVVNEALEEGMRVIGTRDAGATATILPDKDLFNAGDSRRLASLIEINMLAKRRGTLAGQGIGPWTAKRAAEEFIKICK